MAKKPLTVKQKQNKYRALQRVTFAGEFVSLATPFAIMGAVNHEKWFFHESGWKVGIGGSLAIALVSIAIISINFDDEKLKTRKARYIKLLLTWVACAFIFFLLADILNQMGEIMIFGGIGIAGALGLDIESALCKSKADTYGEIVRKAKEKVAQEQVEKEIKDKEIRF